MTRTQYAKVIERELKLLNEYIDQKIIRGERYVEESRKHKLLLQKRNVQRKASLFDRLLSGFQF